MTAASSAPVAARTAADRSRLRGAFHLGALVLAFPAILWLRAQVPGGARQIYALIYGAGLICLLGVSALYHRIVWGRAAYARMRRLDHTTIFVFIACTYTPIDLVGIGGTRGAVLASVCWIAAVLGTLQTLFWFSAPRSLHVSSYVVMGWTGVGGLDLLWRRVGPSSVLFLVGGGVIYTLGAVVYARKRPDPAPRVFGYHEVFHVLVVIACGCLFEVVRECLTRAPPA